MNPKELGIENTKQVALALDDVRRFDEGFLHLVGDGKVEYLNTLSTSPRPAEWENEDPASYSYHGVASKFDKYLDKSEVIYLRKEPKNEEEKRHDLDMRKYDAARILLEGNHIDRAVFQRILDEIDDKRVWK